MKKKGFTLIELIAVIAILAIIITLAGISIVSIKKNILAKERKNLQAEIKAAAQSYHDETGVSIVPVNTLLQIGTIQADTTNYEDETGKYQIGDPVILDPVDGNPINCDAIVYDEDGNAKYTYEVGCSAEAIAENELVVYYKTDDMSNAEVYPKDGSWIAGNKITLSVQNPQADVEYTWINILAPDKSFTGPQYEIDIPESGVIDSKYRLEATVDNVLLSNEFMLRIDAKSPTIENYYITDEDDWKQSKGIYANIIDNESGIYGYAITTKACNTLDSTDYTKLTDTNSKQIELTNITKNSDYNICVKDNAGHLTELTDKLTVKKVDNKKPILSVDVEKKDTYAKSKTGTITLEDFGNDGQIANFEDGSTVTIKYGWSTAPDNEVNCSTSGVFTKSKTISVSSSQSIYEFNVTIDSYTGEGKLYACPDGAITDQAGNTVEGPASDDMYLDNTNPTSSVSINSKNTNYNTTKVDITVSGSDSHSGIEYYCLLTSNNSSLCSWQTSGTYSDIDTGKDYDGTSKTYYGFTKDKAGNVSSVASSTYTLYKYCDNKTVKSRDEFNECSVLCGGGTHSRYIYYKDYYMSEFEDETHDCGRILDTQSCNTMDCCSSTTSTQTSTCSKSCGGGKYLVKYYSTYTGEYCTEKYDGGKCNTMGCCSSTYAVTDWSVCSADCDGGNYLVDYYSNYDGRWCDSDYSGSRCNTQSCTTICDYNDEDLFGRWSGDISGNAGSRYQVSSNWGNWCRAYDCNTAPGTYPGPAKYAEKRICASSYCGSYYGWYAENINASAGCSFAKNWCQCSWGYY